MDVLNRYQDLDETLYGGIYHFYGRSNYVWQSRTVTAKQAFQMIERYKNIQQSLVFGIAVIFSQVFVSGMLLNFLIYMPYCKAKCFPTSSSHEQNVRNLHRALLSGQIQCFEFAKAIVNLFCAFFYVCVVYYISYVQDNNSVHI
jgi:hypothetical protein